MSDLRQASLEVEPSANIHEPQADGTPDNRRADDEPVDNTADQLSDGRTTGLDPDYSADTNDDPSAIEGEIQSNGKIGGA